MTWTVAAFILLVIAAYVWLKFSDKKPTQGRAAESADYPYQKTKGLFTAAERMFLGVLDQAVGQHARVLGKIRVADVLEPNRGLSPGERQAGDIVNSCGWRTEHVFTRRCS